MTDIRKGSNIFKSVTRVVNNIGCSAIVSNIITTTMVPGNIVTKFCIKAAGLCLGSALSDLTNDYTCKKIDTFVDAYENGTLGETIFGIEPETKDEENEEEEEEG